MAKQVIWSIEAKNDLIVILEYYFYKVKVKSYANKRNDILEHEIELIKEYPDIGKSCSTENIRTKITGYYQIIYENTKSTILEFGTQGKILHN